MAWISKEPRAQGFEWAQQIQASADRDRAVLLSEAQRARGEGEAEANRLLAEAFGEDAKFYVFCRALQTYRHALADSGLTLALSPDADFRRMLKDGSEAAAGAAPPAAGGSAP